MIDQPKGRIAAKAKQIPRTSSCALETPRSERNAQESARDNDAYEAAFRKGDWAQRHRGAGNGVLSFHIGRGCPAAPK